MEWNKKAPDKKGWWIRLNAVHRPDMHFVNIDHEGDFVTSWGWGGETGIIKIKNNLHKIEHFYWTYLGELPNK